MQAWAPGTVVMGVQVQQRLTCVTGTEEIDPYIGTRYRVTSSDPGAFQLVAQVSGTSGTTGAGASSIRTISTQLPAPAAFTRVLSWVPQADL